MPITTSSSLQPQSGISSKLKCWECRKPSPYLRATPYNPNPICAECAEKYGLGMPVELSDEPVGTVEEPDAGRTEAQAE